MKNPILLLLFAAAVLFSCKKNEDPASVYQVNGVHDLTIPVVGSATLPLAITQISGPQQTIALSVTGLPAYVTADIKPASGTPTYSTVITFTAANAAAGTYDLKIKGTGADGSVKEYSLKLTITAPSRSEMITGTWQLSGSGLDGNMNDVPDAGETAAIPGYSETLEFLSSGQGELNWTYGSSNTTEPFTWTLMNGDNTIQVTTSSGTSTMDIHSMTYDKMVLFLTSSGQKTWYIYER